MYVSAKPALGAAVLLFLLSLVGTPALVVAQGLRLSDTTAASLPVIHGPPPPLAPATIARDDRGGATVRATRLASPLTLDGRLSEEIYQSVPAASGFIQQVPREGEPATEQTELWVFFDDVNLYIVARCLDSQPERQIATELRRDNSGLVQNESISVVIDTFYDRRNGFTFQTGPLGTIREQAIIDGQRSIASMSPAHSSAWRRPSNRRISRSNPTSPARSSRTGPRRVPFRMTRPVMSDSISSTA
jgi:hypothetical protein